MELSDDGAAFIAAEEGAVPFWYLDQTGHWTIGIGHLWDGSDEFADVDVRNADGSYTGGRRLTDVEMWDLFRTDAARYVDSVNASVTVPLTQVQFDRLVSFAFNWGISPTTGFPATSVVRLINAGDFAGAARELVEGKGPSGRPYDKGLAGVRSRRQREAAAFVTSPVDVLLAVAEDLEAAGIPVVFIDGWANRGRPYAFNPRGLTCHHTATRGYDYDYPSLGIVRDGRSDLPGPLAQIGIGRHTGTVYVIAAGTANHAGGGGWNGLTGNTSVWGIEAENDGVGEEWGPEMTRAYLATAVALCRHGGFGPDMVHRHAEWSDGGKIDTDTAPFDDGDWIRDQVERGLSAPEPEPDPEEEEEEMKSDITLFNWGGAVWSWPGGHPLPLFREVQVLEYLRRGAIAIGDVNDEAFEAIAPGWKERVESGAVTLVPNPAGVAAVNAACGSG